MEESAPSGGPYRRSNWERLFKAALAALWLYLGYRVLVVLGDRYALVLSEDLISWMLQILGFVAVSLLLFDEFISDTYGERALGRAWIGVVIVFHVLAVTGMLASPDSRRGDCEFSERGGFTCY